MTCASCVGRVEKALKAVSGVSEASVNLATERATIRVAGNAASTATLGEAIRRAGYTAKEIVADRAGEVEQDRRAVELRSLKINLAVAAALTLPVFVLEMGSHLVPAIHDIVMETVGMRESWYLQFVLTTLVLFGPGLRFFKKAYPHFCGSRRI